MIEGLENGIANRKLEIGYFGAPNRCHHRILPVYKTVIFVLGSERIQNIAGFQVLHGTPDRIIFAKRKSGTSNESTLQIEQ